MTTLPIVVYVALGGAIGASARYLAMSGLGKWLGDGFPYGTIAVNIIGSMLMGVLIGLGAHQLQLTQEMRAFIAVGVLGGFTTFSAFSLDVVTLFERGELIYTVIYIVMSVTLSVLALMVGLTLTR